MEQTRKLAAHWYRTGMESYKAEEYERAVSAFECAQSLLPVRLTRYWIGRSLESAGRSHQALRIYQELLVDAPPAVEKEELEKRILELQDSTQARKAGSPAEHSPQETTESELKPGMVVKFRKHRSYTISGWTAVSAGAVLTAIGIGLGAAYITDKKKIENASDGTPWNPDLRRRFDHLDGLKTGAGVCLGLGLGVVAAGALLLILRPDRELKDVSVSITPGRNGAQAGFQTRF